MDYAAGCDFKESERAKVSERLAWQPLPRVHSKEDL